MIPCSSHHTAISLPLFRHSITRPRQSWRYDSCLASFSLIPSIVGSSIDTARIPERIRFGYTWRFLRLRKNREEGIMMKKILATLVIISVLCVCCSSFAESADFSVRGGISFKSTKDEIVAYEESQGAKVNLKPLETYDTCTWFTTNCILADSISFGGYEAEVIYYFGENDQLQSILFIPKHYVDDKAPADKQYAQFDGGFRKVWDSHCPKW